MAPEALLYAVTAWAEERSDVLGLALVGSHARGDERPGSDVDLVILCADPEALLAEEWFREFGSVRTVFVESYGALRSLRVRYENGPEVEFGVTGRNWARLPLDAGTAKVLAGGVRILYDPIDLLRAAAVSRS